MISSRDGKYLVTRYSQKIEVFDLKNRILIPSYSLRNQYVWALHAKEDGNIIIHAHSGKIFLLDLNKLVIN